MKYWQENMLGILLSHLEPNEDVVGLLLFGSLSAPEFLSDDWSDIDLLLVVKDGNIEEFFPTIEWLAYFGRLYAYSQSADDYKYTTRACFEDFTCIDFVITTESKLSAIDEWSSIPFSSGVKVMFSRSKIIDQIAKKQFGRANTSPATQEQFLELVRNFRFKSVLAVYKVIRDDLLIALHLAEDLVRDCCVLAMMLRDRTTGTNIHKNGGIGNQFVASLEVTQHPFTSIGILESIKASNDVFEKLALQWSGSYQENRQLLLDWIERAKGQLGA